MPSLIVAVALGFPVAVLLARFFELGDHGVTRDSAPADATLEGYGPYDALRSEHASRVARAREAMLALNATLPPERR